MSLLKVIILCLNLYFVYSSTADFCKLNCTDDPHTVCLKEPCKPSKKCGKHFAMLQMDDEGRKLVLDQHNKLRNKIASGQDTRGGNAESSNMHVLSYDKELEFVAQCWAHSCAKDEVGAHDKCRKTSKFSHVGQNMYGHWGSNIPDPKDVVISGIQAWYDEIVDFDASVIDSFHSIKKKMIGHFTQVVWAETTHIGCGRVQTGDGDTYGAVLYCNYGTAGNMRGSKIYEKGPSCSNCGSEKCNSEYKSLCGEISPLSEDKWTPPFKFSSTASSGSTYSSSSTASSGSTDSSGFTAPPDSIGSVLIKKKQSKAESADSSSSLQFSVFNIVLCITINLILINVMIL